MTNLNTSDYIHRNCHDELDNQLPYNDYFEFFAPDFKLHIEKSNMTNLNTSDYIHRCKETLMENLRNIQHAPSVPMMERPAETFDPRKLKAPKAGVQDTQENEDIDARGGGEFYNDHRDKDDEFSDDEASTKIGATTTTK